MKPLTPLLPHSGEMSNAEDEANSLLQRVVTQPEFQAAFSVMSAFNGGGTMNLASLLSQFRDAADAVHEGKMEGPERIAMSQAKLLDMLFHELLRRGMANLENSHGEALMRLALKAQAQSSRTLETLAVLKKPPVFAHQVNMANQQVVNNALPNGEPLPSTPHFQGTPPALSEESPNLVRLAKKSKPAIHYHAVE